jgi:hypothetical protein
MSKLTTVGQITGAKFNPIFLAEVEQLNVKDVESKSGKKGVSVEYVIKATNTGKNVNSHVWFNSYESDKYDYKRLAKEFTEAKELLIEVDPQRDFALNVIGRID